MPSALIYALLLGAAPMHPTPTPEHARLAFMVGAWDVQMSHWQKPDEPPLKSRGFAVIEPLFGGLHIQERIEGLVGEGAFVTLSWTGFNPKTARYEATRIASTRAERVSESGAFDAAPTTGKTAKSALVLESDPKASDGVRTRTVIRQPSPDTLICEHYLLPTAGPPWMTYQAHYTRRP